MSKLIKRIELDIEANFELLGEDIKVVQERLLREVRQAEFNCLMHILRLTNEQTKKALEKKCA